MNLDSSRRRGPKPVRQTLRFQQREAARAAIVDAAEELIAERGLHQTALVEIAKRAGVAVGTLYNYFADRDDLVRGLFETRRQTLRPILQAAIAAAKPLPFEARLRRVLTDVFAAYDSHRRFLKVVIEAEHLKHTMPQTNDVQLALEEIVAEGVLQKQISAGVSAEMLALALWGTMKAVVLKRVADGRSFAGAADELVAMLLDGAREKVTQP